MSGSYGYVLSGKFMRLKILSRQILLIVALAGLALSPVLFFYFFPISITQSGPAAVVKNTAVLPKQKPANYELPARLKIPKIKVDIALESVGLTSLGAVGVPKNLANAAWYNLGPRPGETGSAVISGHFGVWKNGTRGVFNNLYKLRKGDKLYVKDKKGATATFVVREFRTYGENEAAPDVFGSNDGQAHLNLITCGGVWDKVLKSYPKRLVVFTDKE